MKTRILIACEFSGVVRDAFAALGFDAWSCDLLPAERGGQHIQGDALAAIVERGPWHFIGLHPPCTALCVSGNRHYGQGMAKNHQRHESIEWTWGLWNLACANAPHVYMENPIGVLSQARKPECIIQPWQFGHGETKATCLWLHNLTPLLPSNIVPGREARVHRMPPSKDRWKERSRTLPGIAQAMADQWTPIIQPAQNTTPPTTPSA